MKWKPCIFMPRDLSRITLEITAVRVERLNSISEEDARAEGIKSRKVSSGDARLGLQTIYGLGRDNDYAPSALCAFEDLWESINGPASWDLNPYVWVVEFRRLNA
jgi:hypothetical protein